MAFTGSSLDLSENIGTRNLVTTGEMPFHSYWGPINKNMGHIEFDADLMCWVLNEVNGNPMPPSFDYQISGPTTVCSSSSTFTLNNLPEGCTVSWEVSGNLMSNTLCKATPGSSCIRVKAATSTAQGMGWVQANVTGPCGTVEARKDVWVGTPDFYIVSDPVLECGSPGIATIDSDEAHPYIVQNVFQIGWSHSGLLTDFVGSLFNARFKAGSTPGLGYIYANASNACGAIENRFAIEVVGGMQLLSVVPNPASVTITISEVEPPSESIPWLLRLMSQQGVMLVNVTTMLPHSINVQGLQPGVYILHARRGQHVEQHVVIVV